MTPHLIRRLLQTACLALAAGATWAAQPGSYAAGKFAGNLDGQQAGVVKRVEPAASQPKLKVASPVAKRRLPQPKLDAKARNDAVIGEKSTQSGGNK